MEVACHPKTNRYGTSIFSQYVQKPMKILNKQLNQRMFSAWIILVKIQEMTAIQKMKHQTSVVMSAAIFLYLCHQNQSC